jgi:hypothetical protein
VINQLSRDYARLISQDGLEGLPQLQQRFVLVERSELTEAEEVEKEVAKLQQSHGWLRRQSDVYRTPPGEDYSTPAAGLPLRGEWLVKGGDSTHLRQDGGGGWVLYRYREFEMEENAKREGEKSAPGSQIHSCLCEDTVLLAADGGGKLAYRVYWGGDGGKIKRLFARFAGFK